jgi:signal transduction histidine kinase
MSATTPRNPLAVAEADFVAAHRTQAEHGLFAARFANWRVSVAGGSALGVVVSGLYYYLTDDAALFGWLLLHTAGYACIGAMCWVYERRRPDPSGAEHRRWLHGWTVATAATGVIMGSLLWWLPVGRDELLLSAVLIASLAAVAQAVSRGHRPIVYAAVLGQTTALCAALVLHADLAWMVPICLLFAAFALVFGRTLNRATQDAIMQRLYAQHLAAALATAHRNELELQRQRSVQLERERMMEDMHDGLGSSLLSALVLLERKELPVSAAAAVMRECVDDLRLVVDSREPAARDLSTLVGMLRYRLQPRIQAAGVRLHWHMDDLTGSPWLHPTNSLHLLRILQEALTNALKHSGARDIELGTRQLNGAIELTVMDNGAGFAAPSAAPGRGLATMQSRAQRLGATLTVASQPGRGTTVTVRLPLPAA